MKLKDLVKGGVYFFHTSTPEASTYYNVVHGDKVVVISTVPLEAMGVESWTMGTSSLHLGGYDFRKHKGLSYSGPKYVLVGVLDWNPYKNQQGHRIKEFRMVMPRYIRNTWTQFREDHAARVPGWWLQRKHRKQGNSTSRTRTSRFGLN